MKTHTMLREKDWLDSSVDDFGVLRFQGVRVQRLGTWEVQGFGGLGGL